MNTLLHLDQALFFVINGKLSWLPIYLFLLYLVFHAYGKKGWLILILVTVTILLSDLGSVVLFKNIFLRLRPSHEPSLE